MNIVRNCKLSTLNICTKILSRNYAACTEPNVSGLVLGVYDSCDSDGSQQLTSAGEHLNEATNGYLKEILKKTNIPLGKAEVFTGLGIQGFTHIAFAGLGSKSPNKLNLVEQLNEEKENIRVAMGAGARGVQDVGANKIMVDGVTVPEAAAEGAILGTFIYTANKTTGDKQGPQIELFNHSDTISWASGEINAESQNWARYLSHAPPNLKKPDMYVQEIMEKLCKFDVRIDVRSREWMILRKMNAVMAMMKYSCSPPLLLEVSYCGEEPEVKPITLVGKGNIFDSGGLFLKPYKGMHDFRADLSGSAAILASILAVARKRLPINIRCAILVYENMPTPLGARPGDVFIDKSGVSIRLSDPDNDCRVVLADILNFTDYYSPSLIINVGSFTRSITHAMGTAASGAFTTTNELWSEVQRAGIESGDRFWRMPFWEYFDKLNKSNKMIDMDNASNKKGGDCCQAATFLKTFVPRDQSCCCPQKIPFIHMDCFGTGLLDQTVEEVEPYYRKNIKMGRPTRALIQFLYHRACLLPKNNSKMVPK